MSAARSDELAEPIRRLTLHLPPAGEQRKKPPRANLSAVAAVGHDLFLGTDEGARLDRLSAEADGSFGGHACFDLLDRLGLRALAGDDAEIDIEGLDVDANHLWLVGSHSRMRDKPEDEPLADLARVRHRPERHVLARIPLTVDANGRHVPAESGALRLPIGRKRGALTKALRDDEHLRPFIKLPAKENGLDVEGIAAHGSRILLGLRGPVLRGVAVAVEIEVADGGTGELALQPIGRDGRPWRKHLLDLGGNGIRDLFRVGEDVLILAGPTADLDGRCVIWRWRGPWAMGADSFLTPGKRLQRLLRLPVGVDADHPEGITTLPGGQEDELLVVHDSPAKARCQGEGGVMADLFKLPA